MFRSAIWPVLGNKPVSHGCERLHGKFVGRNERVALISTSFIVGITSGRFGGNTNLSSFIISRTFATGIKHTLEELADQIPETAPSSLDVDELEWSHLEQPASKEADVFTSGAAGRTEQKEEMIFKEVLNKVLANTQQQQHQYRSPVSSRAATAKSSTPIADSILALFDRSEPATSRPLQNTLLNKPVTGSASRNKTASGLSSLDLNSVSDSKRASNIRESNFALDLRSEPNAAELRAQQRINQKLEFVFKHIENLPTNRDILNYFESTIVPRYNPSNKIEAPAEIRSGLDSTEDIQPCSAEEPLVGPETISKILEKCVTVLAKEFTDPLGAIHLFEQSKHHSIEFFSDACSAEVYNQMIRIRWNDYRDLYAVVNLAAELAINAIPPNLETTELLASIYRDAVDSSKGMSITKYGMPLWTGQDVRRLEELNRYRTRFQSSWAARPILRF